jgi:hypothetical protein
MSGKIHALLCRSYIKGRDWYDFSWYIKNNYSPNLLLKKNALIEKIESLDWNDAKQDVRKFLSTEKAKSLEMWNADFFAPKVKKLKF